MILSTSTLKIMVVLKNSQIRLPHRSSTPLSHCLLQHCLYKAQKSKKERSSNWLHVYHPVVFTEILVGRLL